MSLKFNFSKTRDVKNPSSGTVGSAGYDFYVPNFNWQELSDMFPNFDVDFDLDEEGEESNVFLLLEPNQGIVIPSGIKINLDMPNDKLSEDYQVVLTIDNKSGVSSKNSVIVGANTIDSDYQGEIHLHILNVGKETFRLNTGQKLVQGKFSFVLKPELVEVDPSELYSHKTTRGEGGFGSTGLK